MSHKESALQSIQETQEWTFIKDTFHIKIWCLREKIYHFTLKELNIWMKTTKDKDFILRKQGLQIVPNIWWIRAKHTLIKITPRANMKNMKWFPLHLKRKFITMKNTLQMDSSHKKCKMSNKSQKMCKFCRWCEMTGYTDASNAERGIKAWRNTKSTQQSTLKRKWL